MLGVVAMNFLKSPDIRGPVKDDLDLLDRLPAEQTHRRAELQRSIYLRVDDLVARVDREHAVCDSVHPYLDRWRGAAAFLFTVLFTHVWWGAASSRRLSPGSCKDPTRIPIMVHRAAMILRSDDGNVSSPM